MKNAVQSLIIVFNRLCEYGETSGKYLSQGILRNCLSVRICLFREKFLLCRSCQMTAQSFTQIKYCVFLDLATLNCIVTSEVYVEDCS